MPKIRIGTECLDLGMGENKSIIRVYLHLWVLSTISLISNKQGFIYILISIEMVYGIIIKNIECFIFSKIGNIRNIKPTGL